MTLISLDKHPAETAVFRTDGLSADDVRNQIIDQMLRPDISSVVILRDSKTLDQSHEAFKKSFHTGLDHQPAINSPFGKAYNLEANGIFGEDRKTPLAPDVIEKAYGPDFGFLAQLCRSIGSTLLNLRFGFYGSEDAHTDPVRQPRSGAALPGGVTVTTAARGGSTELADISTQTQFNDAAVFRHFWTAPEGSLIALKTKGWPQGHGAAWHRAAQPSSPNAERSVGVGFITVR